MYEITLGDNEFTQEQEKKDLKFIYLNLTNFCNLRCLYCYDENEKSKERQIDIPMSVYENLAKDCKKMGVGRVCLTGGEPLSNVRWLEIGNLFKDQDIEVAISSNGTLINEKNALLIKELGAVVQISLDGDEEMMSFMSGRNFAYRKAVNGIELLVKHGVKMNINSVIARENYHMMDFLAALAKRLDITIRFTLYIDIYNDSKGRLHGLTMKEFSQFLKKMSSLIETHRKIITPLPPLLVPTNMKPTVNPGCGWAHHVGAILYNGDVINCPLASGCPELVAGNILNQSFYEIWTNSNVLNDLRKNSYRELKGLCKECPVVDMCMGSCRLDGYVRQKDQLCSFYLCQAWYDAMLDGTIDDKEFPSKMISV